MTYKGYLIDLDGTIYKGTSRIPAGERFIKRLQETGLPYLFVTNNTTRTPEAVQSLLEEQCELKVPLSSIYTASLATVDYMLEKKLGKRVYVIGETGLKTAIAEAGFIMDSESPDYVVVGLDRELTYDSLAIASLAIQKGAHFISTNPDLNIPTERGLLPGGGTIATLLEASSRVTPVVIGKPNAIIMDKALERLGVAREEAIVVGDNYQTDSLSGIQNQIASLLVTTGFTSPQEVDQLPIMPTHVLASLDEWVF